MISKEEIKKQIKLTETDIKYIKAYDKNLSEYGKQLLQEKILMLENLKYVESRLDEPCGLR